MPHPLITDEVLKYVRESRLVDAEGIVCINLVDDLENFLRFYESEWTCEQCEGARSWPKNTRQVCPTCWGHGKLRDRLVRLHEVTEKADERIAALDNTDFREGAEWIIAWISYTFGVNL